MRQTGFVLTLPLYGMIGAMVVAGGLAVALAINGAKLDTARARLATCEERNATLNGQIARQNEAVELLEKEAEDRQKRAQAALEAARKGQAKAQSEIARLRATKPSVKGDCPAGQAIQRVREGLK